MNYLVPSSLITTDQPTLNFDHYAIWQDLYYNGKRYCYMFISGVTGAGFRTRAEAKAVLTRYGVHNNRESSSELRVGIFTIKEIMYMFRSTEYLIVTII